MDLGGLADGGRQDERELAAEVFAEFFEAGQHRRATVEVHLGRIDPEAEGDEQVERAFGLFLAEQAEVAGAEQV